MADYYLYLSVQVDLVTEEAGRFLCSIAQRHDNIVMGDDDGTTLDDATEARVQEIAESESTTGAIFDNEGSDVWIHSEEYANTESIADLIQMTLLKFDIPGAIAMEWSNDCSKPRLDAYGGGACLITKDEIRWMTTGGWIADEFSKMVKAGLIPDPSLKVDSAVAVADTLSHSALLDAAKEGQALNTSDED